VVDVLGRGASVVVVVLVEAVVVLGAAEEGVTADEVVPSPPPVPEQDARAATVKVIAKSHASLIR
jgi:hypothetical protein